MKLHVKLLFLGLNPPPDPEGPVEKIKNKIGSYFKLLIRPTLGIMGRTFNEIIISIGFNFFFVNASDATKNKKAIDFIR